MYVLFEIDWNYKCICDLYHLSPFSFSPHSTLTKDILFHSHTKRYVKVSLNNFPQALLSECKYDFWEIEHCLSGVDLWSRYGKGRDSGMPQSSPVPFLPQVEQTAAGAGGILPGYRKCGHSILCHCHGRVRPMIGWGPNCAPTHGSTRSVTGWSRRLEVGCQGQDQPHGRLEIPVHNI